MTIQYHFTTLSLLALLASATPADGQVQPELAKGWFSEATKLCERDAGTLWGVSLCGPIWRLATGRVDFNSHFPS